MPDDLQRALHPCVAPCRILIGHAHHELPDLLEHAGPSARVPRKGPLPGHQLAMPAENRVGRDEARQAAQASPSQSVAQHGEPASLVIVEAERAASDLGAEGPVLFEQIGDSVRFAVVEPRGEGEEEKAHGRRVNHGGQHSPERLAF